MAWLRQEGTASGPLRTRPASPISHSYLLRARIPPSTAVFRHRGLMAQRSAASRVSKVLRVPITLPRGLGVATRDQGAPLGESLPFDRTRQILA
jgi:hypothetical protein